MNKIKEENFTEAFEYIFGDFHPSKDDLISIENIGNMENMRNIEFKIEDFMDLVEKSVQAFENEALNIETIYIANVDTFMKEYKTRVFRTKKSMKIVKKQIKYVKHIKKNLKIDIKILMAEIKQKKEGKVNI